MSLDRIQSREGITEINPWPTAAGFVGAMEINGISGFCAATAASGGGAYFCRPMPTSGSAQLVAGSGTITHNNSAVVRVDVSGGANISGVILQAGAIDGQILSILNTNASFTIQFAAAGTSNLANGTSAVITNLKAYNLMWNAVAARWFSIL